MENGHILTILMDNNAGVLLRISGLFSRRAYNISSIAAAETEDPSITRMTIVAHGDDAMLEQIVKQLAKLIDVREIKVVTPESAICREHLMIKIQNNPDERSAVLAAANLFDAKIIDSSEQSITFELTAEHKKLLSFINILKPYGIKQLMKTGITALERG